MKGNGFTITLGALAAISALTVDICVPAQTRVALDFGVEIGGGAAMISTYYLGWAVGQMFWGPVSDRFGRRRPVIGALVGFVAISIACALTQQIEELMVARVLQGFFGGGATVIARAVARDQGGGERSARLISTMMLILGLAPLLAPSLGSGVLTLFDWRAIFWLLSIVGVATAVAVMTFIEESVPYAKRRPVGIAAMWKDVVYLSRSRDFVGGVAVTALIFAGYAAFLAMSAAVAEIRFGVPAEAFGPLFGIAAAALLLGSFLARRTVLGFGVEKVLTVGCAVGAMAGIGLLSVLNSDPGLRMFWGLAFLYILSMGIILPMGTAKALEPAGEMAGFASSLAGTLQALAGAVGAHVVTWKLLGGPFMALCTVMGTASVMCLLLRVLTRAGWR